MTNDVIAKHIRRMAARTDETYAGRKALKRLIKERELHPIRNAQMLSDIEIDRRVMPVKHQALYERLKIVNPKRAQHLWNTAAYIPLTPAEIRAKANAKLEADRIRKAGEALVRVQQGNELKRRV